VGPEGSASLEGGMGGEMWSAHRALWPPPSRGMGNSTASSSRAALVLKPCAAGCLPARTVIFLLYVCNSYKFS